MILGLSLPNAVQTSSKFLLLLPGSYRDNWLPTPARLHRPVAWESLKRSFNTSVKKVSTLEQEKLLVYKSFKKVFKSGT